MKTAIVYYSKHGAAEKIAKLISAKLKDADVRMLNLKLSPVASIENFDMIIIGGSIYYGKIQKKVKEFCKGNLNLLLKKKIALFISCLTKEMEQEEFNKAFPERLRKASIANGLLGGELIYNKLGFLEKFAIRFVGKTSADVHEINFKAIDEFANKINAVVRKEKVLLFPEDNSRIY